ncbi:carcinoembryonic antigen-related cell adhesion molecule 5-like [Tachysurus vachellii]|uniref:carcinoembryonic antigen-related cell adhesion molecule 5-like n=1 Tax=Tachysurus vachellii TaxID=175792 RepID=UPI00296B27C8|nr:carcinoembryonic antigen-related cell adhesion molecule 5-like [Tachysurus vachellii]
MDLQAVCCTLFLLLTCSGRGFGQVLELPESINKTVGENVVITPKRIPDPPYFSVRWKVNTTNILIGPLNGINITSPYKDRVSFNTISLALELRSLTESDTGQYVLSVETVTSYNGQTSLLVLVPVSNVTIVPNHTELVENSTVSFVCSASGSSLSFIWLNGSSEITAGERVQLTDNNRNLTITSVIRGDTGTYVCEAYNSINRNRSLPSSLIIYYGPENVAAAADPEKPFYSSGSNLKLNCSAESRPAAKFQWALNGRELSEMGQELKLNNIQINQTGNYTCIVHNTQTLQYSVSEPISINILVPVSNVAIIPSLKEVELNSTVSFVCSASGSSLSFIWLNGSSAVTTGERVQLTDNNRNLTITSVIRGDTGPYECEAYNSVSRKKSLPFSLTIKINDSGDDGRVVGSLSAGAIAGIVIGVLLGVAAIAGLIFYLVRDKKTSETNSSGNRQNGATPNEGQHELHYAEVRHNRKNQGQPGLSATTTAPTPSYVPGNNKTATSNPAGQIIYSDVRNL